jgi:surface polysaccharide O-acyltransferase-like enzyme
MMKSKTIYLAVGVLLILIALILGAVQHFGTYNIYGSEDNKWYFYGLVVVIGLIGIILAVWALMKKEAPTKPTQPSK